MLKIGFKACNQLVAVEYRFVKKCFQQKINLEIRIQKLNHFFVSRSTDLGTEYRSLFHCTSFLFCFLKKIYLSQNAYFEALQIFQNIDIISPLLSILLNIYF